MCEFKNTRDACGQRSSTLAIFGGKPKLEITIKKLWQFLVPRVNYIYYDYDEIDNDIDDNDISYYEARNNRCYGVRN